MIASRSRCADDGAAACWFCAKSADQPRTGSARMKATMNEPRRKARGRLFISMVSVYSKDERAFGPLWASCALIRLRLARQSAQDKRNGDRHSAAAIFGA